MQTKRMSSAIMVILFLSSSVLAADREYFELRIYRNSDAENQEAVLRYLNDALTPALNRAGSKTVGVFVPIAAKPETSLMDVYVVIPYSNLEQFAALNDTLEADETYQKAAAEFLDTPTKEPRYQRLDSRLMKAFAGMPQLEPPAKDSDQRLLELRIYESHNTQKARLKVDMFNSGEIEVMKDVQLGPVFFGETLISSDVPNLTYMLSAPNEEAHKEHWGAFGKHPTWQKMKKMEKYKGTVSKIRSITLEPTSFSQI